MKRLGKLPVCAATYEVRLGTFEDYEPLQHAYGVCDTANRVIWVHAGMSPAKTLETLAHEALHALLTESGVLQVTEATLGASELGAWEEAVVRVLTPHLMATFGPPQLSPSGRGRKK